MLSDNDTGFNHLQSLDCGPLSNYSKEWNKQTQLIKEMAWATCKVDFTWRGRRVRPQKDKLHGVYIVSGCLFYYVL